MARPRLGLVPQPGPVPSSPRVEIAPGIFAESVVKHGRGAFEAYQVYQVTGGVFDRLELDSMRSLAHLVGILASLDTQELRSWAEEPSADEDDEPVRIAFTEQFEHFDHFEHRRGLLDRGHRRCELQLPATIDSAAAHRRFVCDPGASRRARIWAAETLGDCLPDTDWSVPLLEQTVLHASQLVAESVEAGAAAVLITLEIDGRRLSLTRFDEFRGGEQGAAE
jgi:hypothetical protein